VSFPYLAPGNYTFEVSASTKNGVWSIIPARIYFEIHPPFWKTWWFKLIIILTAAITLTSLFLYRLHVVQEKNKLMVKLNRYMLQALNRQMNPHFIFNAMNTIQSLFIKNDKATAIHVLSLFTSLLRRVLTNSREVMITLKEEIETLQNYIELESYRFQNKFEYEIEIDPSLSIDKLKIPPLLLQPYVENAIIHGLRHCEAPGGKLFIHIFPINSMLCCRITDNGIGRELAEKMKVVKPGHVSLGTKISSQRIDLISQMSNMDIKIKYTDMMDENSEACGTQVDIMIPFMS
jgi:LytS/YehU family sensor histidine kinase